MERDLSGGGIDGREEGGASVTTFGWGDPRRSRGSDPETVPAEDDGVFLGFLDGTCACCGRRTLGVVLPSFLPWKRGDQKGGIPRRHARGPSASFQRGGKVEVQLWILYTPLSSRFSRRGPDPERRGGWVEPHRQNPWMVHRSSFPPARKDLLEDVRRERQLPPISTTTDQSDEDTPKPRDLRPRLKSPPSAQTLMARG